MSSKLTIMPVFDFDKVEHNKSNDIHMDIILQAPKKTDDTRKPLHMVLALDCSSSMMGQKMDAVKSTVTKLIDHLTEDDTIGIVGFNRYIWDVLPVLPMTSNNKIQAKDAIKALSAIGRTHISGALESAAEKAAIADKSKICRIVLLTDGLPTAGVMDSEELVKMVGSINPRVTLSTFGYGTDYDPELLSSMASMGKGTHSYIQKDEDCREAFAMELGGLLSLYAQDIKVSVSPSGSFNASELLSSYNADKNPGFRGLTGSHLDFTIDDIFFGEKKHAIIKVNVPKASTAVCARKTKVCDVTVDYLNIETQKRVKTTGVARIRYVKPGKAPKDANEEVRKQLMMIEATRIQKEAKEKADAGDYKSAQVILDDGVRWAQTNDWWEGSSVTVSSMQLMAQNCSNRSSYTSTGSKIASSALRMYSGNRGYSSALVGTDTSNAVFTVSEAQTDMLKFFSDNDSDSGKLDVE